MTKIAFERRPNVYLPELTAYKRYVEKNMPGFSAFDSADVDGYDPMDFDIVWRFMGLDTKGTGRRVIHEYNSLSTGNFARFKNAVKQTLNARPYARVFLNETVRKGFFFPDSVPFRCRDMGIDLSFFQKREAAPEYDFIYAGSLNRGDSILSVLEHFKTTLKTASLLVVGNVSGEIHERYGAAKNIVFTGRVPHAEVSALMAKARYGLNLMPDRYPFNLQTATKVLEYCAAGLPVVSTDYRWIREFERNRKAKFFLLDGNLENLTLENLKNFPFQIPNVDDCEWGRVIEQSRVFDLL